MAEDAFLRGKCALVTGSTQGIGLAIARAAAHAGCNVVLNGLSSQEEAARLRREIERETDARTIFSEADLRRPAEIEGMMAAAEEAFGPVEILVNNAVVRHAAPIDELAPEAWDESIAVNLTAAFHTIRLALPMMRRQGWGRIINVSSIYGLIGAAGRAAYVTTKTALIGLTRAVALETAGESITCNAVCPGTIPTPVHRAGVERLMADTGLTAEEAERQALSGKQPTGRFIAAEDLAALVLFLCGPASRDITGAALPMDGGWSIS